MGVFRRIAIIFVLVCIFVLPFHDSIYGSLGLALACLTLLFADVLKMRTMRFIWQEFALCLLLILAITLAVFKDPYIQYSGLHFVFYYGTPLLMLLAIRRVWNKGPEWLLLGYAYLAGCVVSTIMLIQHWMSGAAFQRISVGDLNTNYVSYSLATGITVGVILISLTKSKVRARTLSMIIVFLSFGILLTGTRGSIISIVALLLTYLLFQVGRRPFYYLSIFAATVVVSIILFNIIPEEVSSRILMNSTSTDDVSSGRYDLWSLAYSFFLEAPLIGNGIGYFESYGSQHIKVHNVFLSILVEFGIVGFILYTSVIFSIIFFKAGSMHVKRARIFFIVSWLPIAMTGVWEFSSAPWFVFAWLSLFPKEFNSKISSETRKIK